MAQETATIPTADIDVVAGKCNAPHLEAVLFADYAARTLDGKATVSGVFDRVFIDPEKKESGRFYVYIRTVETLEAPIEIKLIDPKGRIVATGSGSIENPADVAELRMPRSSTLTIPFGLQIGPEGVEGSYWFEILYKGQSLGGAVLSIEFRKKED